MKSKDKSATGKAQKTTKKQSKTTPKKPSARKSSSVVSSVRTKKPALKLGKNLQVWSQPKGIKLLDNSHCEYICSLIKHIEVDFNLLKSLATSGNEENINRALSSSTESLSKFIDALVNNSIVLPPERTTRPDISKLNHLQVTYIHSSLKHVEAEICILIEARIMGDAHYEGTVASYTDDLLARLIEHLVDVRVIE